VVKNLNLERKHYNTAKMKTRM